MSAAGWIIISLYLATLPLLAWIWWMNRDTRRMLDRMREGDQELAEWIVREAGKPRGMKKRLDTRPKA